MGEGNEKAQIRSNQLAETKNKSLLLSTCLLLSVWHLQVQNRMADLFTPVAWFAGLRLARESQVVKAQQSSVVVR